jgi:hypothetical protein
MANSISSTFMCQRKQICWVSCQHTYDDSLHIFLTPNIMRTHRALYLFLPKSSFVGSYKSRGMCWGNKWPIFYKEYSIISLL